MARRRSGLADFMDLVAMLPRWGGVLLSVVSYLLLHRFASQPGVAPVASASVPVSGAATQMVVGTFAWIGQYVVPALCLFGSAMSAWRRWERRRLVGSVVRSDAEDVLDGMTWQQFERLVGEGFRLQGYAVVETGRGGPDGGVDLVLIKNREKYLVQCKQWRAFKVGVEIVRELYGVMTARNATGGFVVTSGRFSDEARKFAAGTNIELVDGVRLRALIKQVGSVESLRPDGASAGMGAREGPGAGAGSTEARGSTRAPTCPVCSRSMVLRRARRGANAGKDFWGCSGYPACNGTRALE